VDCGPSISGLPGPGSPNALFITAGINGEANGLFAEIQQAPEPGTFLMLTLAGIPLAWRKLRR